MSRSISTFRRLTTEGQRNKGYPEPTRDTTGTLPSLRISVLKAMVYTSIYVWEAPIAKKAQPRLDSIPNEGAERASLNGIRSH